MKDVLEQVETISKRLWRPLDVAYDNERPLPILVYFTIRTKIC